MKNFRQISIAGCHGKTTTTAMIATILVAAGLDPSYAIGCGIVRGLGLPGHFGTGDFFIAEADEYITDPGHDATPRFLWQHPETLVITTIDFDHPDVYKNIDEVGKAYSSLVDQMQHKKMLIYSNNDKNNQLYLKGKIPNLTYGFNNADLIVSQKEQKPFANTGSFSIDGEMIDIKLKVPGFHNLLNAGGAFLAARELGIDAKIIVKGLERFEGASRRFEYIGERNGTIFIDDYAHHPQEIISTLNATREWYPTKKIISIFQPHTYSRTKALLSDFSHAFTNADEIAVLPIYASAREVEKTIDTKDVVSEIAKYHNNVSFQPTIESFFETYSLDNNTIVLFLGAGDIGRNARRLLNK